MLVVPPPEFLLHSQPRTTYDYFTSTDLQARIEKPAPPEPADQYPSLTTDDLLYLAAMALSLSDIDGAFHFLMAAITRGSVIAMNCYYMFANVLPTCDTSEHGHLRQSGLYRLGARYGSIDAVLHMGQIISESPDMSVATLSCFFKHYQETQHPMSACTIAALLERFNGQDTHKWLKLAAAKGEGAMVRTLATVAKPDDRASVKIWRKVAASMDLMKGRPEIYKRMKACVGQSFGAIKFMVFADYVLNKENVFFEKTSRALQRVDSTGSERVSRNLELDRTPLLVNGEKARSAQVAYPLKGRTAYLLQVLKYASPVFEERNLNLARAHLFLIYKENPTGIFESELWRAKAASRNPDDLVRCGFVACLLGDNDYALDMCRKAAKLGNRTGSAMAGYILIHRMRQIKEGLFFLAQCVTDPLAQIHLYLYTQDPVFEKRALALLNMPSKTSAVYEMCGDLFADGIKYPFLESAARAFYGVAHEEAMQRGEDITELLVKMQSLDL